MINKQVRQLSLAEHPVPLPDMTASTTWPYIISVTNSIIGVTILAMPFCFQQCGILLGIVLLWFSTWLTLASCQLLVKAGLTSRRRSYEFLAYYTHGRAGKFVVEVGMIGLQIGTLVAQIVIIGDIGPDIISKFTGLENSSRLRNAVIILLCVFVGLPLALLKNLRALSKTSSLCVIFYMIFVLYMLALSKERLLAGDWLGKVNIWRMDGLFRCLPIYAYAFGCQTQIFLVYDELSEPSMKKINSIVHTAVNMCSVAYLLVGFFGYIAFNNIDEISGDIFTHVEKNLLTDAFKLCFVISLAVTIPLIVFPCRASLYTLLFPQTDMVEKPKASEDMPGDAQMPELHFQIISVSIILVSMVLAILFPNVELVLALNGSTVGTVICYIFPAIFFLKVMSGAAEGKGTAKAVLLLGLVILLVSTYTTLTTKQTGHHADKGPVEAVEMGVPLVDVDGHIKLQPLDSLKQPKPPDMSIKCKKFRSFKVMEDNHEKMFILTLTKLKEEKWFYTITSVPHFKPGPNFVAGLHLGPVDFGIKKSMITVTEKNGGLDPLEDRQRQEPPNPQSPDGFKLNRSYVTKKDNLKIQDGNSFLNKQKVTGQVERELDKRQVVDPARESNKEGRKEGQWELGMGKQGGLEKHDAGKWAEELLHQLEKQQKEQRDILQQEKEILQELKQHNQEAHKGELLQPQGGVNQALNIQKQQQPINLQKGLGQQAQQPINPDLNQQAANQQEGVVQQSLNANADINVKQQPLNQQEGFVQQNQQPINNDFKQIPVNFEIQDQRVKRDVNQDGANRDENIRNKKDDIKGDIDGMEHRQRDIKAKEIWTNHNTQKSIWTEVNNQGPNIQESNNHENYIDHNRDNNFHTSTPVDISNILLQIDHGKKR